MARLSDRLPANADGEFYVDSSCIDCDACRVILPQVFGEKDDQSYVIRQPANEAERRRALAAVVACPTSSIGTVSKLSVRPGVELFPERLVGDVYYCGFHAESSFGAASYLIRRPEGNVLIDSPRAARPLMDRIEALGGVRYMFLTHGDDVADHEKYARRFGCERILHQADAIAGIERTFTDELRLADDLFIVPVPGHTRGSAVLLHENVLFTGDHLWGNGQRLSAGRGVCWYSWREQTRSMERLLDLRFEWVLPGHGRRFGPVSADAMHDELSRLIQWMRSR